ncbi:MAG: hypothetical protein Kow0068_02670 [Marinilabiliales bacterium]
MKLILIYIICILCILVSCRDQQVNSYQFKKVNSISLPLDDPYYNIPSGAQYAIIDGVETIILYLNNRKLTFYDLKSQKKYHEIKLGIQELYSFYYLNKDSIFLFYVNQYNENDYIDSNQFILLNFYGEIKKRYSFKNDIIWSRENQPLPINTAVYPSLFGNKFEILKKDKAFFFLRKMNPYNIGTEEFLSYKSPVVSYYDLSKEKLETSKSLWYPYIRKGVYYPSDFPIMNYCVSHNKLPIIRFFYSSKLFEWDYEHDKIKEYTLKSNLLDTIMPTIKPTLRSDNNIEAMYLNISYDPYRKLYFSILMFSPDIYGIGTWSMIIADENLNYIGEIFRPEMSAFRPIFTKEHIVEVKPGEPGFVDVNFYKLIESDVPESLYIASIKDSLMKIKKKMNDRICSFTTRKKSEKQYIYSYLINKNIVNKNQNFSAVCVYIDAGCPGCNESVLRFVGDNLNILEKLPFYLIISGRNSLEIKKQIKYYNLVPMRKMYIDTLGDLILLDKSENKNPHLLVYKNDSLLIDSIYLANDIYTGLIPTLTESLGLEIEAINQ